VTVLGGLVVDGVGQVQFLDNDTRPHIEVLPDDLNELIGRLVAGAVGLDEQTERLSDTNGVRKLDKTAACELSLEQRLGDPAGEVSSGTIDLGVILARESTSTVGTPPTVGVDNDLTSGETSITLRTTNDELARGLDLGKNVSFEVKNLDDLLILRGRRSCRQGTSKE